MKKQKAKIKMKKPTIIDKLKDFKRKIGGN